MSACMGSQWMIEWIHDTFPHLRDWRSLAVYANWFEDFAAAIHAKGSPYRHIVAFVDGKVRGAPRLLTSILTQDVGAR